MDTNAAAPPIASARPVPGVTPRLARRVPLRPTAPRITGRATVRERRFACCRSNRRARAAVSVAPFRETPGTSAQACATPSKRPSSAPASPRPRACGARSARAIAIAPSTRPAAVASGVPSASILRSKARPARGGRRERERHHARAAGVELAKLVGDLVPQRDEERQSGAAVERHLEALARLGVELLPLPSGKEGNERDVRGARDGQELGRPLDQAEQGCALVGDAKGGAVVAHAAVSAGAGGGPAAAALDQEVDDAGEDRGGDGIVEVVEVVAPLLPVVADLAPDEREHGHPGDAAERA